MCSTTHVWLPCMCIRQGEIKQNVLGLRDIKLIQFFFFFKYKFSTLLCPLLASHVGLSPPVPSVYSLLLSFLVSKALHPTHALTPARPGSLSSLVGDKVSASAPLL